MEKTQPYKTEDTEKEGIQKHPFLLENETIHEYEIKGIEKDNLRKRLFTPEHKPIYKIEVKGGTFFNFMYTSLTPDFEKDFDKIRKRNYIDPNAFVYAKESFSLAYDHLLTMFSSPRDLSCFSGGYPIDIFLAEGFDEFCSIGNPKKRNIPSFAKGRVSGTTLVYIQDFFLNNSKKNKNKVSKQGILGNAHELLHIFSHYYRREEYGNLNYKSPFLFTEGLTVICANQISDEFKEGFISAEHLFLENDIQVFEHDNRTIKDNKFYQSAGYFMDYLLKTISKRENIDYKESFQKVFSTIGSPDSINDKGEFDAKKYLEKVFNLDILQEYTLFLEKKREESVT